VFVQQNGGICILSKDIFPVNNLPDFFLPEARY
jgi:hypothetical protein